MKRFSTLLFAVAVASAAHAATEEEERYAEIRASETEFTTAIAAHRRGDYVQASELYHKAIEREPHYVEAMVNLARVLIELEEIDEALSWLDKAEALRPDYPDISSVRGTQALRAGRPREAVASLVRARHHGGDELEVLINLGAALSETGAHAEAIAVLAEAIESTPRDANAVFNLALAFDRAGRTPEAIHHYRDFLALSETGDRDRPAVRARVQRLTQLGATAPSVTTPPRKLSPAKEIPKWN